MRRITLMMGLMLIGQSALAQAQTPVPPPVSGSITIFYQDPVLDPVPDAPRLLLSHSCNPLVYTKENQPIVCKFTVTNTGNIPINSCQITGSLNVNCPRGTIPVGGSVQATGVYTTTRADVGKDISIEVRTSGNTNSRQKAKSNTVSAVVKYAGRPELSIAMTASPAAFSRSGEKITYTYTVRNTGTVPITTFALTDKNVIKLTCRQQPPLHFGGPLAPGGSAQCVGTHTTTAGEVGKDIVSTASVTGKSAVGAVPPPPPAKAVVRFAGRPALALVEYSPTPAIFSDAGERITFNYRVRNTGTLPISSFALTDNKVRNIRCPQGGPLGVGVSATCSGTYAITRGDVGRDIFSRASLTGTAASGAVLTPLRRDAVVVYIAKSRPRAKMTNACNPLVYTAAGQSIICNFTVTNTGNVPIQSCQITGSRINVSCPQGTIPVGKSLQVKGVYTSTAADVGQNIVMSFKLTGLAK